MLDGPRFIVISIHHSTEKTEGGASFVAAIHKPTNMPVF